MEQSGLVLDNIFNPKNNSWVNGKNMVIPKGTKSFQNERGFSVGCDLPYPCIGEIIAPNETIVFLSNNAMSEIGVVHNNVYTPKLREPLLNFQMAFPITGTYTYNHLGELIIAWTDNYNSPKIINLTNLPFVSLLTTDLALVNKDEYTLLELFPTIASSVIDVAQVISGGNLVAGAYYLLCSYSYEDGSTTSWFGLTNPISIYGSNPNTTFNDICGAEAGQITDKAITVNILDIDRNFTYITLAVISTIGGVSSGTVFDAIPIVGTTISFNLSSLSKGTPISITELLVNNPVYQNIKTITNHNGELIAANVTGLPFLDIQPYVNNIEVYWYRNKPISLNGYQGSYKDPLYIAKFKSFRAGEVYGFLAAARLKKGGYYGIYHIPGRPALTGDKTQLTALNYPNDAQLDNTVYKFQTRNTAVQGTEGGRMGYWENRNERYPNNFPPDKYGDALANTPVRHHKFPTLSQLKQWDRDFITDDIGSLSEETVNLNSTDQTDIYIGNSLNRISYDTYPTSNFGEFSNAGISFISNIEQNVELDLTSTLLAAQGEYNPSVYARITIKLYTNTNNLKAIIWEYDETIFTENLVHIDIIKNIPMEQGEKLVIEYDYFSGNISVADLEFTMTSNTSLEGTTFSYPLGIYLTGIDFPDEIKEHIDAIEIFYYERTVENISIIDQGLLYPQDWYSNNIDSKINRFHGFDIQTVLNSIKATHISGELLYTKEQSSDTIKTMDYVNPAIIPTSAMESGDSSIIRPIVESKLFPADNTASIPSNYSKENCLYIKTNEIIVTDPNVRVLANLCVYKTDMYNNMFTQRVVSTGYVINITEDTSNSAFIVFGGDTFISPYGFMLWSSLTPEDETTDPTDYVRMKVLLAVESTANIGLRYETGLPHEKFYPKTNVALDIHFKDGNIFQYGNFLGYNADYNLLNNLKSFVINNPNSIFNNLFKYRVIRSLPQSTDSNSLNWRSFPATLYYDMPMNKGEINGLVSQGQTLFILHKYTTYKAILKDLLQLFNTDAYLAEGDIFDRAPIEIYPISEGYIGYQSMYATITTEFGLVIVDRLRGKIFLIADTIRELTTPDVEEKIKEYLTLDITIYLHHPILGNELTYLMSKLGTALIYSDPDELTIALEGIDNPVVNKGITLNYDKFYKRILLTVNNINRYYNSTDITKGIQKSGYLKFSCITSGNYGDIGTTIHFILGTTSVTLSADIIPGTNKFIISNTRESMAANIVSAIQTIISAVPLSYYYTVEQHESDIIIYCNSYVETRNIVNFTTSCPFIKLAENIPFYIEEDKSVTLSLSLQSMMWLFKHDYIPTFGYNDVKSTKLIKNTLHDSKIMTINDTDKFTTYFDDTIHQSFIDIPANLKTTPQSIFVDNIQVAATVRDILSNHNYADKSITHYAVYTQNQCTGIIPIITLGYINEGSTAYFDNRNLICLQFRDIVIDHNLPFIDEEGNFISSNLANSVVTEILENKEYIISNISDPSTDYIRYNGIDYKFNNQIIKTVTGNTNIEFFGNIILKTYKSWENYSYIADKLVIVRLIYDNDEQHLFELNNVFVNNNKK